MLKQHIHQQSISGSSNVQPEQESTKYDVRELANDEGNASQTGLMLKLTDECCEAIKNALKSKSAIRMRVVEGIPILEIGHVDGKTINFKCAMQNQQATDVIFYDTKQKHYKNIGTTMNVKIQVQATDKTFAEMKEKTQKLVEAEQQKKAKEMTKTQKTSTKQHSSKQHHYLASGHKKNQPTGATTHSNILAKLASSTAAKRPYSPVPAASNEPGNKIKRRETEASTMAPSKNETKSEKKEDEKLIKAAQSAEPFIKMDPFKKEKDHLFYVPKRKTINRAPSISPASTTTSTPKTISPPLAMARPPSVDSAQLQHSSSCSPEDATEGGGPNLDEQNLMMGSMTLPMKPSQDWTLEFGKIHKQEDAKRYHECFKADYPEYRECYEALELVAEEFRKLQRALYRVIDVSERAKIEKEIRIKFASYQSDREFLRKRQRHHDLRSKLQVIKEALAQWSSTTT